MAKRLTHSRATRCRSARTNHHVKMAYSGGTSQATRQTRLAQDFSVKCGYPVVETDPEAGCGRIRRQAGDGLAPVKVGMISCEQKAREGARRREISTYVKSCHLRLRLATGIPKYFNPTIKKHFRCEAICVQRIALYS